jgi:hypothetical protein
MKISTSSTFDTSTVANTQSFQELNPFFDYMNAFTTDVIQAFNKKITLADNISYTEKSLTLQNNSPLVIGDITVKGVFINSTTPVTSYKIEANSANKKVLTVYFQDTHNIKAKSAVWVAGTTVKYLTDSTSTVTIGDFVNVSGFGTAANNGTYQIIGIDGNYLYLNNYNRSSATGDELKAGYVGSDRKTYSITLGVLS